MLLCVTFGFLVGCFGFAKGLTREFLLLFFAYYGLQFHMLVEIVQVSFVFDMFTDIILQVTLRAHFVGAAVNTLVKLAPIGFLSAQDTLL